MRTLQVEVFKSATAVFDSITVRLDGKAPQRRITIKDWKSFALDCGATPEEIENAVIEIEQL